MKKPYANSDHVGAGLIPRRPDEDYLIEIFVDRELDMALPSEHLWNKGGDLLPADEPEHGSAVLGAHGKLWTPT